MMRGGGRLRAAHRASAPDIKRMRSVGVGRVDRRDLEKRKQAWYLKHRYGLWLPEDHSPMTAEEFEDDLDDEGLAREGEDAQRVSVEILL